MPKNNPETVETLNEQLRLGGIKLTIQQRGSKLAIFGAFPKKDGGGRKQQRVSLGLDATPWGLKEDNFQLPS